MTDDQETTIAAIRTKGYTLSRIINYPHLPSQQFTRILFHCPPLSRNDIIIILIVVISKQHVGKYYGLLRI